MRTRVFVKDRCRIPRYLVAREGYGRTGG